MAYMHTHEIVEYYDNHPNVTLKELSRMSGWTVQHLKLLLMFEPVQPDPVASYVAEGLGEQ
jgi:hypothetical protein